MAATVALTMALLGSPAVQADAQVSHVYHVARHALAGDYGKLCPWQQAAYQRVIDHGAKQYRVWQTQYGMWDRGRYRGDDYHLASNVLQRGTVVFINPPGQLRVVTNCGSPNNDRVAHRKGYGQWCDVWTRTPHEYGLDTCGADLWVIRVPKKRGAK